MPERPNRIRYFRRLADLSQDELADRVSVHRQTVSDWERGIFNPSLEMARELARVLDCSIDDLFMPTESGGSPDNSPSAEPAAAVLPRTEPTPASTPRSDDLPVAAVVGPQVVENRATESEATAR